MNHMLGGLLGLILVVSSATTCAEDHKNSASPIEQYKLLLKEFQDASSAGRVLSDEERTKFVGHVYKLRYTLASRFLELAENNPTDPIAVDALIQAVWQVNTIPWPAELVGKDIAGARVFAILERDHIQSDKLGPVCERISYGFCKEYESFLRAVLEKNPHRDVQAQACLALAHFLGNRLQRIDLVRGQPKLAGEFAGFFGQEYLDELKRHDREMSGKEAEALFEQAVDEFGDVDIPGLGTVGARAKAALFEIRHLALGKVPPDIEGEDQDGNQFKLSDYRGKVVLLDFWSQW